MPNGCGDPAPNWWKSLQSQPLVVDFSPFANLLSANVWAEVREANTTNPVTVIDVDDAFAVDIHLEVTGPLTYVICGYWCISCCLESLCGDDDYRFPQGDYCCILTPLDPCGNGVYDTTICVPGDVVKESQCGTPYEVTVVVTVLTQCVIKPNSNPKDPGRFKPLGIAGSFKLPMLTFYSNEKGPGE